MAKDGKETTFIYYEVININDCCVVIQPNGYPKV